MKLAVVYDKNDHKLQDTSYSLIYKGMLDAIIDRFTPVIIHDDCSAQDIEADAILFYDVHSTHHIRIDGLRSHKAVKLEYWTDPNQEELRGLYQQYNQPVHKLGRKQRVERAFERGVEYIICPFKEGYHFWLDEFLGSDSNRMQLYFPLAPALASNSKPLKDRKQEILGNGATWDSGKNIYAFRRWAFEQPNISVVPHWIKDKSTPSGPGYVDFLSGYAGALALHDYFPVPKYFEIPIAGCVSFVQYYPEYEDLGFVDGHNYIMVNKENFNDRVQDFLDKPGAYQLLADAGRKLMEDNYTAWHFAEFIERKIEAHG